MERKQDFPALTALKGLFIWIIVLHNTFLVHALFDTVPGMSFIRIFGGSLGNSMFFMLSGYLMAQSYGERIRQGKLTFGPFLHRRLSKLYPMYFLSNLAALVVAVWQYGISAVNLKKIAFTLLLQMGGGLENGNPYNSPTWFVSALVLCYIVYYAGTSRFRTETRYRCFLAAGVAVGYYLSKAQLQIPFCYAGNGVAFQNYFLGCILAEVLPCLKKKWHTWLKPVGFAVLAGSVYLMLAYGVEVISGGSGDAFSFMICPLILYLAQTEGLCAKVLRWKPLVFLGKISMNVFYWHLVLYFAMSQALGGITEGTYGLYLVILLAVSIGIYFLENRRIVDSQHT